MPWYSCPENIIPAYQCSQIMNQKDENSGDFQKCQAVLSFLQKHWTHECVLAGETPLAEHLHSALTPYKTSFSLHRTPNNSKFILSVKGKKSIKSNHGLGLKRKNPSASNPNRLINKKVARCNCPTRLQTAGIEISSILSCHKTAWVIKFPRRTIQTMSIFTTSKKARKWTDCWIPFEPRDSGWDFWMIWCWKIKSRNEAPGLSQLFFNQPKSLFVRKSQEILDGYLISLPVRQGGMKSRDMETKETTT